MKNLSSFQHQLGYFFQNEELLIQALRHRSYSNEHPDQIPHNERLEFLGDAVLEVVISEFLYHAFPEESEGALSHMRSRLVNTHHLANIARSLHVGEKLFLSKGELLSQGQNKESILAGAMEALIAAIYLDGGLSAARLFIEHLFTETLWEVQASYEQDYKTLLQELVQHRYQEIPSYKIVAETGPDHDKQFTAEVSFHSFQKQGVGKSKKMAEQEAAQKALESLKLALSLEEKK